MRPFLSAICGATLLVPAMAAATPAAPQRLFATAAVSDAELARVAGTGDSRWRTPFRMTDDLAVSLQRQTASVGTIIKDLWVIDVTSPLIAANVRALGQ